MQTTDYECAKPNSNPYVKQEWLDELNQTQFLTRCRNGEISRDELNTFVEQHQIYSRCFTRYLGALLSNIEADDQRLDLTRNLFDEMGLGDAGNIPHSVLYRNMMSSMGLVPDKAALPSTTRLIDTMFECCKSPHEMHGLGALCLGAEGIVPFMYSQIVNGFLAIGESLSKLLFFTMHIECDDEHAATMYNIIDKKLKQNPSNINELHYGAEKLIRARIDFFNGLSAC